MSLFFVQMRPADWEKFNPLTVLAELSPVPALSFPDQFHVRTSNCVLGFAIAGVGRFAVEKALNPAGGQFLNHHPAPAQYWSQADPHCPKLAVAVPPLYDPSVGVTILAASGEYFENAPVFAVPLSGIPPLSQVPFFEK